MELTQWPHDLTQWMDLLGGALGLLGFIFFPLELWRLKREAKLNKPMVFEMLASTSPLVLTLILGPWVISFITGLYTKASAVALFHLETTPLTAVLSVILVDFLYYWDHRCSHVFRPIWAISHSVHHSSETYNQTVALRVSFIDGFISPWFYLPAVLIGFDPLLVLASFGFILGYQQWIHTETIGRLKWFDAWLNTPANHRVHHGVQPQYIDKNYGAVLMLWDQLFGTYVAEDETVKYGLTTPIGSPNPLWVHTAEAVAWVRDVARPGTLGQRFRRLVLMA